MPLPKANKNPNGGRPRIEITDKEWKQIENACSIQCTADEISSLMGISVDTLERRIKEAHDIGFAEYYKKHSAGGKSSLRRWQYQAAEKGNVAMLIWLGKQWLGQADKVEEPPNQELTDVLSKLAAKLPGA